MEKQFEFRFLKQISRTLTDSENEEEVFSFEELCNEYGIKHSRNAWMLVPKEFKRRAAFDGRSKNAITRRGAIWFTLKHNPAFCIWAAKTVLYDYDPKSKGDE